MKILWHGVAPWQPTGYGQQAAIWATRLVEAGHEVAISAQGGSSTAAVTDWHGIPVYPSATEIEATGLLTKFYIDEYQPDLVVTLYDGWQMGGGQAFAGSNVIAWLPVDTMVEQRSGKQCGGLAAGDRMWLQGSGARPIAMSQHGKRILEHAGYEDVPVIPHGIDTRRDWTPPRDRDNLRAQIGLDPDTFAVGIMGTNIDPHRKSLPEQILAFSQFHVEHPQSKLFIHSTVHMPGSLMLDKVVRQAGVPEDAIGMPKQALMYSGMFPQSDLRAWYGSMDVVMNCARGEGFGLAAVEAQACGTPVILTDAHTGPELAGPGFLVRSQEFWNWTHESWWATPVIDDMVEALDKAHASGGQLRDPAREFAEQFDVRKVWPLWEAVLESAEAS